VGRGVQPLYHPGSHGNPFYVFHRNVEEEGGRRNKRKESSLPPNPGSATAPDTRLLMLHIFLFQIFYISILHLVIPRSHIRLFL
jgi:hypothetical protein